MIRKILSLFFKLRKLSDYTVKICKFCGEKISTDPNDFDFNAHASKECVDRIHFERDLFLSEKIQAEQRALKNFNLFQILHERIIHIRENSTTLEQYEAKLDFLIAETNPFFGYHLGDEVENG